MPAMEETGSASQLSAAPARSSFLLLLAMATASGVVRLIDKHPPKSLPRDNVFV
jgi:hypothetical protein